MLPTRVLVVEDENIVAMDLRTRLTRLGYAVPAVAASGAAALRKAEELAPDVVLMDIVLKGDMDGVQAAEQVRQRFGIPVIYLTAHSDENTLQRARITEPFGYILKPFEDTELHATIEMALYRHQLEQQLRESEARYRSLVEHSNDVIAIMDADRVIRYCSPSTTQVLGYLPEAMVGKSLLEFLMPEKAPLVFETIRQMLQQPGVATPIECFVRHSDGSWRAMLGHVTDLLDDPAIKGIVIHCHDITERQRADDALQTSERKFRSIVEHSSDGIVLMDEQGSIVEWNPGAERITGLPRAEVIGRFIWDIQFQMGPKETQTPAVYQQIKAAMLGILNATDAAWLDQLQEADLQRPDGMRCVIQTRGFSVQTERGFMVGVIIRDITERKRAEEALQQHNRDLAQLYSMSQTLTSTLDRRQVAERLMTTLVESLNAQGGSIWLLDSQGTGDLVCQLAYPDPPHSLIGLHLKSGEGIAGRVAQTGKSAIVSDVSADPRFSPAIDALTGFHTLSVLAVPLLIQDQVIGALEAINKQSNPFDAHDQVLLEMLSTSASIAIENARLVEALRQQTSELQARNEELDAFAHTVAHDLKNPVSLIVGFAETLEGDADLFSDEQQRALRRIARSGRKMNNIIEELLLLAGVRQQKVELQPLDMSAILAEAQRRLVDMTTQYRAEIILERPTEWPVALGYAPWMEEVWVNYLGNAITYGGRPPRIEVGATGQPDGRVRFWVRDHGSGLSLDEQARLFTPFTRLGQVRARGHGLGLSIVRRIVEKLGGQVGVESDGVPGRGSTFYLDLPSADSAPPAPVGGFRRSE